MHRRERGVLVEMARFGKGEVFIEVPLGVVQFAKADFEPGATTRDTLTVHGNSLVMVTRDDKAQALCQRCHAPSGHPGSVYDNTQVATSVRIFARGCVQCHSTIHGSNHPAGNRFIR